MPEERRQTAVQKGGGERHPPWGFPRDRYSHRNLPGSRVGRIGIGKACYYGVRSHILRFSKVSYM